MKHPSFTHKNVFLLALAFISMLLIVASYFAWDFGLNHCGENRGCKDLFIETLSAPFYYGFFLKSILIVSIFLLMLPDIVFKVWRWFALIYIPLALYHIFSIPVYGFGLFSKTDVSNLHGYAFLTLSLALMAVALIVVWYRRKRISKD